MNDGHLAPGLPDLPALHTHAPLVGSVGSGKARALLESLGLLCEDTYGRSYFQAASEETLTAFLAKYRDIESFADFARHIEGVGSRPATEAAGSEPAEPPR
jgi:hypothetical protein